MKTDFVANASHELRTPIAAIRIAFDTLHEIYREDPEQAEKCFAIVDGHLGRLQEMLSDLLDLSRVEVEDAKPQLTLLRAVDLFTPVRATLGAMAQKKLVELVLGDPAHDDLEFVGDKRLLNLILKNLVENSIKFTPAGGRVTASLSIEREPSPGRIILSVSDNGCGIPPEHLDRVFERFYQVDAARSGGAGRGTGLGLAIVKHAALGFGGKVDLQSTVGVGTTIRVTFPKLELPTESPSEEEESEVTP
jgi:two-component system phosphate regulon sensor histidine kinase PhoR